MTELQEGPSFTVDPATWTDVRNDIVRLGNRHISQDVMDRLGFFKVSTTGWNETFFPAYVKAAVESGSFGQLLYGRKNMVRSVVMPSLLLPGWRESRETPGRHKSVTMKALYQEFRAECLKPRNKRIEEKLNSCDRYAAENLQTLALGKTFWYGESFSECVNESPIVGVEKLGDLNLPVNIMMLYLRFQVLFHNFAAARGVSGMWTYVYGPWSGTVLHLEDAFLPSVNLNLGPGSKLWYFVPRSHFKQLQDYYARMGFSEKGDGCAHHFQHKRQAPSIETLLSENIPVFYIVQRPGDIIFADGCVFHEVINWGYGFSQSSNILLPSWINVAEAGLHLRSQCCNWFISDSSFSANTLTDRLRALLRRLLAKNASREELEAFDRQIERLTKKKWDPIKPAYRDACSVIGFGEPVHEIPDEVPVAFRCRPEDVRPDPHSPATISALYLQKSAPLKSRKTGDLVETSRSNSIPAAGGQSEELPVLRKNSSRFGGIDKHGKIRYRQAELMCSSHVVTKKDFLPRRSCRTGGKEGAARRSKRFCREISPEV